MPRIEAMAMLFLKVAVSFAFLLSAAVLVLGAVATFFACTPGTDIHDAKVLIRQGPLYILGGAAGLLVTRRAWRAIRGPLAR